MRRIFREYGLEFLAFISVATGIFLVINEFSIRHALQLAYYRAIMRLESWMQNASTGGLGQFSTNDLLGWLLFVGGLIVIIWRGRYHFLQSEYWKAANCPKCGSGLHRIHRTSWDRFLSHTLLREARRYQCKNPECGWSGLRRRHYEDQRHERHDSSEAT